MWNFHADLFIILEETNLHIVLRYHLEEVI